MKDNLNHYCRFRIEDPSQDPRLVRTGTVVDYNPEGTEMTIQEDADDEGKLPGPLKIPVNWFAMVEFIREVPGTPAKSVTGADAQTQHDSRRVSAPKITPETRARAAMRKPADNIPGAAGPDEFAKPE